MATVDPKMKIKWALICSVPEEEDLTSVGRKIGIFNHYEEKSSYIDRIAPGDLDGCIIAYEKIHKEYPSIHLVIHILPWPASDEYQWMKSLSLQFGVIRQGVLLENAKARFSNVDENGSRVFENVAQWISRSGHRLCTSKNPSEKSYDIRVGSGEPLVNKQYIPHVIQTAVSNVLHGFPSRLNEFGIAQLFGELTVTGVTLKGNTATVVFANKFQAYHAYELNNKILDRYHTLRVMPLSEEVRSQFKI